MKNIKWDKIVTLFPVYFPVYTSGYRCVVCFLKRKYFPDGNDKVVRTTSFYFDEVEICVCKWDSNLDVYVFSNKYITREEASKYLECLKNINLEMLFF